MRKKNKKRLSLLFLILILSIVKLIHVDMNAKKRILL